MKYQVVRFPRVLLSPVYIILEINALGQKWNILGGNEQIINRFTSFLYKTDLGAVDMATDGIDLLINICFKTDDESSKKPLVDILVNRAIKHLGDAIPSMREQCLSIMKKVSELTKLPVLTLLEERRDVILEQLKEGLTYFASFSNSARIGFIVSKF